MPLSMELGSQISAHSHSAFLSFPVSMLYQILYGRGEFAKSHGLWSPESFFNGDARGLETLEKLLLVCPGWEGDGRSGWNLMSNQAEYLCGIKQGQVQGDKLQGPSPSHTWQSLP